MNAQTIMICSGKGGTGKSTVSVLLGAQLGAWSRRVLLIELDSGLRSVDMIAGARRFTISRMFCAVGVMAAKLLCPAPCTLGCRSSALPMRAVRSAQHRWPG